jgi:hypothetical protein
VSLIVDIEMVNCCCFVAIIVYQCLYIIVQNVDEFVVT